MENTSENNLDDALNTSKVLNSLTKLEAHIKTLSSDIAIGSTNKLQELSALKIENRDLKTNHKQASKRLDSLIIQLEKQV